MDHVTKTTALIPLSHIAHRAHEDFGIPERFYNNLIDWITRGIRDLHLFRLPFYEEAKINMSDINTITLPADCERVVRLGIPYGGKMWWFDQDLNFVTSTTTVVDGETSTETLEAQYGEGVSIDRTKYSHYSETGGHNQYHYVQREADRIVINGFPRCEVILRYVSSGVKASGETLVPGFCQEYLIALCGHRYSVKVNLDFNTRQERKQMVKEEGLKIEALQINLPAIFNTIARTWTQTPKR